jgi:hypothetical protein
MITGDRLNRLWKRTISHLIFICLVATGIVLYLLTNNSDGKGLTPLEALGVMAIIIISALIFFYVARTIKNIIGDRFGQREDGK